MKSLSKIIIVLGLSAFVASCADKNSPNYQYFPDMYEPIGYETYGESDAFANGKEAQEVPKGAVKRGFEPYDYANTNEGYALAKANLKSPLDASKIDEAKAAELYVIYCAICHGDNGNGQGNLVKREKILGVPSYADREITEGSTYHVLTYGLNSMGSYANQLTQEERWMVSAYVMKLKSEL
jgi:mono/diheme cytochrome c family protein